MDRSIKEKLEKEFHCSERSESSESFEEFCANHPKRVKRWGGNPGTLSYEALIRFGPPSNSYHGKTDYVVHGEHLYYFYIK